MIQAQAGSFKSDSKMSMMIPRTPSMPGKPTAPVIPGGPVYPAGPLKPVSPVNPGRPTLPREPIRETDVNATNRHQPSVYIYGFQLRRTARSTIQLVY